MLSKLSIDQSEALRICARCIEQAATRGVAVSVAVVDEAGALLQFTRMDGARAHTVELALRKAKVAASVGASTKAIHAAVTAGLVGNLESVGPGGWPVKVGADCAGGVGVSGASVDVDEALAEIGAAVLTQA